MTDNYPQQILKNKAQSDVDNLRECTRKSIPLAAQRALKEAEERRKANYGKLDLGKKEINGRDGPEAVRYGDWEKDGIISDF